MNCVTEVAQRHGRTYITPEDVSEGDAVEFDIESDQQGREKAVRVRRVG